MSYTGITQDSLFFVFDVESVGLHGEAFAVAGGIYNRLGEPLREFAYHCDSESVKGTDEDRAWINANVTLHDESIGEDSPFHVRTNFWQEWLDAKENYPNITMFVECGWPVEARFLNDCIDDDKSARNWSGPYPMHEIASFMLAAGMNPMATYERLPSELPAHEPLADARQSVRLLVQALNAVQ